MKQILASIMMWVVMGQLGASEVRASVQYSFPLHQLEEELVNMLVEEGAGEYMELGAVRVKVMGTWTSLSSIGTTPEAEKNYNIASLDFSRSTGRFNATLMPEVHKEEGVEVQGVYERLEEVPVLVNRVYRGDIIQKRDIEWIKVPVRRIRGETVLNANQLEGMQAKRTLMPGRPLMERDVQDPVVVNKGNIVQMLFRSHYVELKTAGEAQEDGARGDIISMRNVVSGKIVRARVVEAGVVQVEHMLDFPQLATGYGMQ